jgi:lipopolysaccharide transport system permease protein
MQKELIIKPKEGWVGAGLKELWEYRELVFFFVWRDIIIRYKQTVLGVLWVIFQPLVTMIIFSIFFGKFAKMPSEGIPYPVFVYVGLLFWNYFSLSLSKAAESIIANESVIQKVYFPRLIIPISSSLTPLVDFCVTSVILGFLMLYYGYVPSLKGIAYVPLLLVITFFSVVGIGCFVTSINVKYRDVRYIMPFFIQILLFLTPVIYPVSIATGKFKYLFAINPMSGVIETARAVILQTGSFDWRLFALSILSAAVFFVIGIMYFRKVERFFSDFI